jgi:pimeloyl-ACP methyl ester carboxylesterase
MLHDLGKESLLIDPTNVPDPRAAGALVPVAANRSAAGRLTTETALTNGIDSVALWFGSSDRPLFAWLDLPADRLVVGAAVICPTMGLESEYSARAVRDLAHGLAARGWAALRADYLGTGDSSGTSTDPDLVTEWLDGVREAIAYVRSLGAPRVAVVGMRIGATLAAAELARGGEVDDLVLWDPCATGKSFLREQRWLAALRRDLSVEWGVLGEGEELGTGEPGEPGAVEGPGVVFSAATVSQLGPLTIPPGDRALASRELILFREGRRLERTLAARQELPHVESAEIVGQEALLEEEAITPRPTLDRIISWLTDTDGSPSRLYLPERHSTAVHRDNGAPGVCERSVELGPAHLFGILSEPEGEVDPAAPMVVFLNVGRIGHHGPGRLWVDLARSLAVTGLRCLRVDLSGIGDSPTRPGRTDLVVFPADAPKDMHDIRTAATTQDGDRLIWVGLCSGAAHAIEAALAEPVAAVCAINPVLTYARWGQEHSFRFFEPQPEEGSPDSSARQAWRATRPWASRLLTPLARFRGATRWVPNVGWWIVNRCFLNSSPVTILERMAQSGTKVLVVVGNREARRVYRGDKRRLRALIDGGSVAMETIPRFDHALLERTGRERVSQLVHGYVTRVANMSGPPG